MYRILAASTLCLLLCLVNAEALAQQTGAVEVKKLEAHRFKKLASGVEGTIARGFLTYQAVPEGKSLLVLWVDLALKFPEGDESIMIPSESFELSGGGKTYPPVGHCNRAGQFDVYFGGLSRFGKPETETVPFSMVFVVPDAGGEYTVKLGDHTHKFTAPEQQETTVDATKIADFKVTGARLVKELKTSNELGPFDNVQAETEINVESTVDKYLMVEITAKGKVATYEDGSFQFAAQDLGLLLGRQVYVAPIGAIDYGEFIPEAQITLGGEPADASGELPSVDATLVFPLPGRITEFKLLYLTRQVAEGKVPAE